jgi:uncharacterized membrane protein
MKMPMLKLLKKYCAALTIVLALDFVWLLVLMRDFYSAQLREFARPEIFPFWAALIAWALIPLGIVMFVDSKAKTSAQSLRYGAIYGFVLYGLYGFTNYATLAGWTLPLLFVDVLWGSFLCAVSACLLKLVCTTR